MSPNQDDNMFDVRETDIHATLWRYEGTPEQHCEMIAWVGEDVILRPVDGSPIFTCNGSFAWPVRGA